MTFDQLQALISNLYAGKLASIKDLKSAFEATLTDQELIKQQINKAYTLKQIKQRFTMYSDTKKAAAVDKVFNYYLSSFNISGSLTYSFGQNYYDVLKLKVLAQTQAELDQFNENTKAIQAEKQRKLTNPESIRDFEFFISFKGRSALSDEQLERYETLLADQTIKNKTDQKKAKASIAKVELDGVVMELRSTKHTKKGYDLFVVVLSDRVQREVFNELKGKAKRLGGWYSSYTKGGAIPGFQFKEESTAKQFMQLQEQDLNRDEAVEQKLENKQNSVAAKFLQIAEQKEAAAKEKLNADRKTNTARRVRMARSAEADAQADLYFAKVLRNVAQGIEKGEIKYLSSIDSMAQLVELNSILYTAHYRRMRAENIPYAKWEQMRDDKKSIELVEYPLPKYHVERLESILDRIQNTKGIVLRLRRIQKLIQATLKKKEHIVFLRYKSQIEDVKRIAERVQNDYDKKYLMEPLLSLDRIQRMNLVNLPTLKTALREYIKYRKVDVLSPEEKRGLKIKNLERNFVGKKIDGFFPTPKGLAQRVVALAEIENGHQVLEPSAGLGHLADVILNNYPQVDLTLIESYYDLAKVLKSKGYQKVIHTDFLKYDEKSFDRIIMNPPYEKLADIDHVRHAYSLLKPGGRLVAILANNKSGSRKKVKEFSSWVEDLQGSFREIEAGAFKSAFRPTGVNTIMLILDKEEAPTKALQREVQQVVQVLQKPKLSKKDKAALPSELKDISKENLQESAVDYIKNKAKAIAEGRTLSEQEIIQLALTAQPLIRSAKSTLLDLLFTNKRVLEPTIDGLLRWLSNPSGYDLRGVDISAKAKVTVKPKRPKKDLLQILKLK